MKSKTLGKYSIQSTVDETKLKFVCAPWLARQATFLSGELLFSFTSIHHVCIRIGLACSVVVVVVVLWFAMRSLNFPLKNSQIALPFAK
jgi:hypothetical protein